MIGKYLDTGEGMRRTETIACFDYLTGRKITAPVWNSKCIVVITGRNRKVLLPQEKGVRTHGIK